MNILLTGARGQLGVEWVRHARSPEGSGLRLAPRDASGLDITDAGAVSAELDREEPHAVVNCAAYTAVDRAEEERDRALQVNAEAVGALADLCAERGIMLMHYSTDYVFPGRADDRARRPEGYREEDRTSPLNWYGETKWRGEEAIRASGCRHLILRLSWLCGAGGGNFVKTMLRLASERDHLQVVDDQWGSPTFTRQAVRRSLALMEDGAEGTWHCSSAGILTWHDFAEAIFDRAGLEVELEAVSSEAFESRARRPAFSKLCCRRLEEATGRPMASWEEGLGSLLEELKENHES
ncbi:MAG: dTDP-4-dehydrorhamnose reductase [Balneolaceae bacterium]|nr:dTDP-4-dehydrorhamnose reductase [Balneolaceae bacterium]